MWWSGLRGAMAFALAVDASETFGEAGQVRGLMVRAQAPSVGRAGWYVAQASASRQVRGRWVRRLWRRGGFRVWLRWRRQGRGPGNFRCRAVRYPCRRCLTTGLRFHFARCSTLAQDLTGRVALLSLASYRTVCRAVGRKHFTAPLLLLMQLTKPVA